jgi:hypothetical protein
MITKHKDTKANCWRCGREGHYMLECYAKKTEEGEEIVKGLYHQPEKERGATMTLSRLLQEKKAKVATVVTDAKEEKRIWEVESENEDF